ncbi:biotin--protein ligase [Beggiatoa sp. PS]|nr:biotin--protein ligase [Beggiatoa sp. PS]
MYRQVLSILADGQRHTAKQLTEQLAINTAVLEQAINTLSAYGIQFNSSVKNTYQLAESLELLEHSLIQSGLSTETLSHLNDLDIFDVIDSTNRYALDFKGVVPYICLAEYQTAGRGRQGRQWISPYASGLCLSIKYRYQILNESLGGLNIALAVTVVRVLQKLGVTEVGLKWPNDILWHNRKLAGLLLESRHGRDCDVVIGIGINVKMPLVDTTTITQTWVDLETILEQSISRNTLAAMLIEQCLQTLIHYPQLGLSAFHDDWHRFDLSYGQPVTLKIPSRSSLNEEEKMADTNFNSQMVMGTAYGIDEQGALLLQVGEQKQRYVCGEVSLRL